MPNIDSPQLDSVVRTLQAIRERAPLVQNITNYVVMNNTANALLAVGASPAMVHAAEEVEDFVAISSSLVVNIGTLSPAWVASMKLAAEAAVRLRKPWMLDPVGAGATPYRTGVAAELLALRPTVLRGNASEVLATAGEAGRTKGVDSTAGSDAAVDAARAVAKAHGCVVVVTGESDVVTDGERVLRCRNGHVAMTRVTGLGCSLSAITGAAVAVNDDPLHAALAAAVIFGVAGEIAQERSRGPGSLQVELLDALASLDAATLRERARLA